MGLPALPLQPPQTGLKPNRENPRERGCGQLGRLTEPAMNGGPQPLRGKPHEWGWKKGFSQQRRLIPFALVFRRARRQDAAPSRDARKGRPLESTQMLARKLVALVAVLLIIPVLHAGTPARQPG